MLHAENERQSYGTGYIVWTVSLCPVQTTALYVANFGCLICLANSI